MADSTVTKTVALRAHCSVGRTANSSADRKDELMVVTKAAQMAESKESCLAGQTALNWAAWKAMN